MTRYRNPWHKPGKPEYGPAFYETVVSAKGCNGYLIYHRHVSVWDVVKDGVCITQRAGPNGAHEFCINN